jgi:hypothetical protein
MRSHPQPARVTRGRPYESEDGKMASSGKKKTTFAKLARESRLRERRIDKQAKKDARKREAEIQPAVFDDAGALSADGQPTVR